MPNGAFKVLNAKKVFLVSWGYWTLSVLGWENFEGSFEWKFLRKIKVSFWVKVLTGNSGNFEKNINKSKKNMFFLIFLEKYENFS